MDAADKDIMWKAAKLAREDRRARLKADPTLAEHGKKATYNNWMCRCDECTEAVGVWRIRRDAETVGGDPDTAEALYLKRRAERKARAEAS